MKKQPLQSNLIEITLQHGCPPVNLLHVFRTPFPKSTFWWLLLSIVNLVVKRRRDFPRFLAMFIQKLLISSLLLYINFHNNMFSDNDTALSYNSFATAKRLDEILKIFIPVLTEVRLRTYAEAVVQRYSVKKVFFEILQNSLENSCARVSFLIKLQA